MSSQRSRGVMTTARVKFIWHFTTTELSGAGAQSNLLLALPQGSGTGYTSVGNVSSTLFTLGNLFTRWRVTSLKTRWCGQASSTVSETSAIKYVPETLAAATSSNWYDVCEGQDLAFHLPYQTTPSNLSVPRGRIYTAGLPWLMTENSVDSEGCAGTVCFLTSNNVAESGRVEVDLTADFEGLRSEGLDLVTRNARGGPGPVPVDHLLHLHRLMTRGGAEAGGPDDTVIVPNSSPPTPSVQGEPIPGRLVHPRPGVGWSTPRLTRR